MNLILIWPILLTGMTTISARAESRRLSVQSKFDQYELLLSGETATVGGKPVDMSYLQNLIPVLTDSLGDECPVLKGPPDIKIREAGHTRQVYLQQGVATDGQKCMTVDGEGLLYFPVHRDFLTGPKTDAIPLKSPLKILRDGVVIVELTKKNKGWVSTKTERLLNWDFIERLESSLASFTIRFRVLPAIAKDKARIVIQSAGQSYEFYKISNVLWAVKKPGMKWLEASPDWSFWYDFDDSLLDDRFSEQIRFLEDPAKDQPSRLAALQKLENFWSPNLRDLYHKLVLGRNEDTKIQAIALRRLKAKPSPETAGVMVQLLDQTQDGEVRRTATQILKTTNPKGPLFNPNASAHDREESLEYWRRWWSKSKSQPE